MEVVDFSKVEADAEIATDKADKPKRPRWVAPVAGVLLVPAAIIGGERVVSAVNDWLQPPTCNNLEVQTLPDGVPRTDIVRMPDGTSASIMTAESWLPNAIDNKKADIVQVAAGGSNLYVGSEQFNQPGPEAVIETGDYRIDVDISGAPYEQKTITTSCEPID